MAHRIFLAGAAGVVGQRLTPLLLAAGHRVAGTTRSPEKAQALARQGVEPVVVDVFDADRLAQCVAAFRPDIVIHQLTDLPRGLDPALMAEAGRRNARIRTDGTRNLMAAALAAGVRRFIAQSIAWIYAPGPTPHRENAPLDTRAEGARAVTIGGVVALENAVLSTPPSLTGIVLRYGRFYGPGTGAETPPPGPRVHVDAAAHAALLALSAEARGIYNVAEPNDEVATAKAERELGWRADFRR
ncbi:MAG TPA: NAD(P)-dependent oxidoreductase [Stellaceae bacterium]|jgi:nucleoside-diphosphate-sugar epimerase|nr:NAD(P)-dependent oxidoreductase [Stellaceae bacterium]